VYVRVDGLRGKCFVYCGSENSQFRRVMIEIKLP
jgi:hypothetical protein